MCRFVVVNSKLRQPSVAERKSGFFCKVSRKEGNGRCFFLFTLCMSHKASVGSFEIVGEIHFWCIVCNF